MITSRFVYERSIVRDVASVFANTRVHLPMAHYPSVDRLIVELCDLFHEHDPGFDVEDFHARARAFTDRSNDGSGEFDLLSSG